MCHFQNLELQIFNFYSLFVLNKISDPTNTRPININFTYGDENEANTDTTIIKPIAPIQFKPFDNSSIDVVLQAEDVGHIVVGAASNDINM